MKFDLRLFLLLSAGFILVTIIGTISHESGHYLAARLQGFDAILHYASTTWKKAYYEQEVTTTALILITLGGPLQTMLTGTIGFLLLWYKRLSFQSVQQLSFMQWTIIFIALFWLRQTVNFITWVGTYIVTGNFSSRSDEVKLAYSFHLPLWSISLVTAVIGLFVLAYAVYRFIPKSQRLTFLLSGLAGGATGYILWLYVIGKFLIP